MSSPYQLSLLRRTFAAMAIAAIAFTASDTLAAGNTVKLNGGNKNDECTFSSMSITPDGGVTVQCSGTSQPPPDPNPIDNTIPGVFVMASATMNASPGSTAQVTVTRTLGGLPFTLYYWYTGPGCGWSHVGAVNFLGGALSATIPALVGASGTTCTVNLGQPAAPASLGSQTTTTISVTGTVINNPPPVTNPNCPTGYAPPQDALAASFAGLGNPLLQMQASGQVVSIPLPSMTSSGQVTFGESAGGAYTPQPVTLEVSVNKCPGLIETDYANRCNIRSTNGNYNSITWLAKAYQGRGGTIDASTASQNGLCWGGDPTQYYINARWSYASCAFGAQVCGFAIQYNLGGY